MCIQKCFPRLIRQAGLLTEAGLKEWSCGSAKVSKKHANFLLSTVNMPAKKNIVDLMIKMRSSVAERTSFYLRP